MARMTKEQRLKDKVTNSVIKILVELGWECRINVDENIVFCLSEKNSHSEDVNNFFKDVCFYISYDCSDYIEIYECCWKTVKLSDYEGVDRLKRAISEVNVGACITTSYLVNKGEQTLEVSCSTNIPLLNNDLYLKKYLYKKLIDIYWANKYLDHVLKETEKEAKVTRVITCLNSTTKA